MTDVIRFNKKGGPIVAEATCGQAQQGSYTLTLWEAEENTVVMEKKGNFLNSDDDSYELPKPNGKNEGRLLQCSFRIALIPPINKYAVSVKVTQDGKTLGVVSKSGASDQPTVPVDLFAELRAEGS